jgi:DNA-binding transcriptional ArsR family regulator
MTDYPISGEELAFKLKADFLKALAHPLRLALIEHLKNGEKSVGQLASHLGENQSSISKNLAILKQVGILQSKQEKSTVYYSIKDEDIFKILRPISDILGKKLRESERLLQHLGR